MSEQSFPIPRAWNTCTPEEAAQAEAEGRMEPPVVTITLTGWWPSDLRERVFDAMRWAAQRAAISSATYGDPNYLERWEAKNPRPQGLELTRKENADGH